MMDATESGALTAGRLERVPPEQQAHVVRAVSQSIPVPVTAKPLPGCPAWLAAELGAQSDSSGVRMEAVAVVGATPMHDLLEHVRAEIEAGRRTFVIIDAGATALDSVSSGSLSGALQSAGLDHGLVLLAPAVIRWHAPWAEDSGPAPDRRSALDAEVVAFVAEALALDGPDTSRRLAERLILLESEADEFAQMAVDYAAGYSGATAPPAPSRSLWARLRSRMGRRPAGG